MVRSSIFFQSAFVYHMVHNTFYLESKLLITVYILLHIILNNYNNIFGINFCTALRF